MASPPHVQIDSLWIILTPGPSKFLKVLISRFCVRLYSFNESSGVSSVLKCSEPSPTREALPGEVTFEHTNPCLATSYIVPGDGDCRQSATVGPLRREAPLRSVPVPTQPSHSLFTPLPPRHSTLIVLQAEQSSKSGLVPAASSPLSSHWL